MFGDGHTVGIALGTVAADETDAGSTVAIEKDAQDARKEIIERFTSIDIFDGTVGAGVESFCMATLTDRTPRRLLIGATSRAFPFPIFST